MSETSKSRVQSQFGAAAQDYATSEVHARGESLALLRDLAGAQPGRKVLDVATGAGHTALLFAAQGETVVAVDLTDQMLIQTAELAKSAGLTRVLPAAADAEHLPFVAGSFELVTCRLAFHHFPHPLEALGEFRRVLKPGGLLGFTDNVTVEQEAAAAYYNRYESLRDPSHHRVYTLPELEEMLTRTGFQIETVRELSKEFEFEEWADRQRAGAAVKETLREMMRNLPEELQPLFRPRWADGTLYFSLWEAVLLARGC